MDKKKELQDKYEQLYDKKAYHGWDEEKLKELIAEKETEEVLEEEFEIDAKKTYHFRLMQQSTNPRKILPREAKVWHEATQKTRVIRLCSTEDSPFKDDQEEGALVDRKPLIITDGNLYLEGVEANRIRFLLEYDGNASKSKTLTGNAHIAKMYELVDNQKEISDKLTAEEVELKARVMIKDSHEDELRNYLRSVHLLAVDSMTEKEVRLAGNNLAKDLKNAKEMLNNFNNPLHKIKAKVQKLFIAGELDDKENTVRWSNGSVILQLKKDERADETIAKWVLEGTPASKDFISVADTKLKA